MGVKSASPILPADFQPVAWISGNNTAVYFDTGYVVQMTDTVEIYAGRSNDKNDGALVQSVPLSIFQCGSNYGRKYGVSVKGRSYIEGLNDYRPAVNEFATFRVELANNKFFINETEKTFPKGSSSTQNNLNIFSNGTYSSYNQVRTLKIWDSTDTLVFYAIAGYIKSTSEIVFYDTVSGNYLHAQGSGTCTKGEDV